MQEADVVRDLIVVAAILSFLAACSSPDAYPTSQNAASSQAATPCADGCQPGDVQIRMDMTAGQMLFDRK
jgi:hypothetical protein